MADSDARPSALDAQLLYNACRGGDLAAQSAAYRNLWEQLYRVAHYLVANQRDATDLAQDCAQNALLRIHQRIHECHEPAAFLGWSQRIVSNITIDELRRRKRFTSTDTGTEDDVLEAIASLLDQPEERVLGRLQIDELRQMILQSPISDRSRRVVIGRFFDGVEDDELAQQERELSSETVLASHVQVTRAKNLAKLRGWEPLRQVLLAQVASDRIDDQR